MLYETILNKNQSLAVLGAVGGFFVFLEITRRLSSTWNDFLMDKALRPISRPHERHQIVGATYYLVALFIVCALFPRHSVSLAALVLGFGDPAANLIGKAWGTKKIYKQKSWAGFIGFIVVASLAGFTHLTLVAPGISLGLRLATSLSVAVAGALVELFSSRIDDNFSIPIVCALVARLMIGV